MFQVFRKFVTLSILYVTISGITAFSAPPQSLPALFDTLCREQHRSPGAFLDALIRRSQDQTRPAERRAEDALLTGRLLLIYRERPEFYDIPTGMDPGALLRNAAKLAPDTRIAASATTALAAELIDRGAIAEASELVQSFLATFQPADKQTRTPLLLLAGNLAIADGNRYADAVKYFEAALDAGIANDIIRCNTIYRIGMIHALKLHDAQRGRYWFNYYLERYPYSFDSALIRTNLQKLENGK